MGRYDIDEVEIAENDQILNNDYRRFAKIATDQPRHSPIRRKDKLRQEKVVKPKAKRKRQKIQHKFKYDWRGE